jgi:hypothetical protein
MAANPMPRPSNEQYHVYHADAHILSVELEHPIKLAKQEYGRVVLERTRREGLITQSVGETNIEGLISFKRGHSRVAGAHIDQKTDIFGQDHAGYFTLATAVLEGYNVEDIITADRVVAQLSTQHAMTGDPECPISHVPRVNFIGTRFENLQVGGYPIAVELDLAICGPKPDADPSYLDDESFLDRVNRQLDNFLDERGLPDSLEKKYSAEITHIDDLRKRAKENRKARNRNQACANGGPNGYPSLRCSLVKKVRLPAEIPGVSAFGNAIFVQDFGTVHLGELEVGINDDHSNFRHRQGDAPGEYPGSSNYFTLNMVNIRLGCPGGGNASAASVRGNGQSYP